MTKKIGIFRRVGVIYCAMMFFGLLVYPFLTGKAATLKKADAEKEIEQIKPLLERQNNSPLARKHYSRLLSLANDCLPNIFTEKSRPPTVLAPSNNVCTSGSLAVGDPTFNRPTTSSTGSGFGSSCTLSGSATAVFYDAYEFEITGCAAFPTVATFSLCGPAGCAASTSFDSVLLLYRNVSAGDALTAANGLTNPFNPTSSCTNARALNDDTNSTPTSTGGSTCNQLNTSDCTAGCSPTTSLSQMKRSLGSGRFTVVVTTFSNGATANYNLYVDAPAAGCSVSRVATAAGANIGGRVLSAEGRGIANVAVSIYGGSINTPVTVKTNPFGYYNFNDLAIGETYVVTVANSKKYNFANPSQVVNLTGNVGEMNFIGQE